MKSNSEKISHALELIKDSEPRQRAFFGKLATSGNPVAWLDAIVDEGYLAANNNPSPREDPNFPGTQMTETWPVLWYLTNLAKMNFEKPDRAVTEAVARFIDEVMRYKPNEKRIKNWMTDDTIFELMCLLPEGDLTTTHISYVKELLNSGWESIGISSALGKVMLPRLIRDEEGHLLVSLLNVILAFKKTERRSGADYTSLMGNHWLFDALKTNKEGIARISKLEASNVAISKIESLLKADKSRFSYISIPTIEEHSQTHFPDRYDCQLAYFLRDMLEKASREELMEFIPLLLSNDQTIFRRIGIHLVAERYAEVKDLFWARDDSPLEDLGLKHEIYRLFDLNSTEFSEPEIGQILEWINTKDYLVELKKEAELTRLAYNIKEWLTPLLKTGDERVRRLYDKNNAINSHKIEHPGFLVWVGDAGFVSRREESYPFDRKSVQDIANDMQKPAKKDDFDDFDDVKRFLVPTTAFRDYVKTNPTKFDETLECFLDVPLEYRQELIAGFTDAWKAETRFSVDDVLSFIKRILENNRIWSEEFHKHYNFRDWLITDIGRFITAGCVNDSNAFPESLFPEIEGILTTLLDRALESVEYEKFGDDLCNAVLNSSKGSIYNAAIHFSLRYARVQKSESGNRWKRSIMERFSYYLNRDRGSNPELSVTLGHFLPNLMYLDETWVKLNFDKIFPGERKVWGETMSAYLFFTRSVYQTLYNLFRDHKHYHRAIKFDFDEDISGKFVQQICIGYLEGWDSLSDKNGLLSGVLSNGRLEHLKEVIRFISNQKAVAEREIEGKVKSLWSVAAAQVKLIEDPVSKSELFSELGTWISLISNIDDESFELLKESARNIRRAHRDYEFVRGLLKHVRLQPSHIGDLFLEVLRAGNIPSYDREDIAQIVGELYKGTEADKATEICKHYLDAGHQFLRPIQREQQKQVE